MKNKSKPGRVFDVQNVLDVIGGRWKGAILASLLIERQLDPNNAIAVIYQLTSHGKGLESIILILAAWGKKHRQLVADTHNATP